MAKMANTRGDQYNNLIEFFTINFIIKSHIPDAMSMINVIEE